MATLRLDKLADTLRSKGLQICHLRPCRRRGHCYSTSQRKRHPMNDKGRNLWRCKSSGSLGGLQRIHRRLRRNYSGTHWEMRRN